MNELTAAIPYVKAATAKELAEDLPPLAFDGSADAVAAVDACVNHGDGKDAGQQPAPTGSADAMNAVKASSASSKPNMCLSVVALKKQMAPPMNPMMMAYIGVVNPLAGVMTTNPATAPEIAPSTVGLPVLIHSTNIQPRVAAAAAKCVAMKTRC